MGGALLLLLGLRIALQAGDGRAAAAEAGRNLWWLYASTFMLTLANPATILSFVAVFAALGLSAAAHTGTAASLMVLGVFLGSAAWWLALTRIVAALGHRLTPRTLRWIARAAGAVIAAFGGAGILMSGLRVLG